MQLKSGSKKALADLHALYYVEFCRIAFKKLPDEMLVEELVQDVFLNLWEKRAELDGNGNIRAYLYATLRNKALYRLRSEINRSRHYLEFAYRDPCHSESPEDEYLIKELEEQVNRAIAGLPDKCREAFTLTRYEQFTYKQVAGQMNITVNTVEKHIGKALDMLRKELSAHKMPIVTLIGLLALYRL